MWFKSRKASDQSAGDLRPAADLEEIARTLNRTLQSKKLSAAVCPWLSAISIFVDDFYENFDFDIIGPKARFLIAGTLKQEGFRQRSGRVFETEGGRIEFPRPNRSLASDPARELEDVLDRGVAGFATPTQVLLVTWRREGPVLGEARKQELLDFVWEQAANLDKVSDWLHRTEHAADYGRFKPRLEEVQKEVFELRRRGRFKSRLPK